ncbi:MAG: hypothetical protein VCE43_14020 [Myxococcota bacterium]
MGSLTLVILNPRSRAAQRRWPRFEPELRAALGPFELEQTRSRSQSYFANVASFGLGGLVDELVNRSSKALFFGGGMQVAPDAEPRRVWLDIDGEPFGTLPERIESRPDALTLFGVETKVEMLDEKRAGA